MRRVVRVVGWGAVGLVLAGIFGYILLVVTRGISPPVVPITSTNELYGYATGDAVLVEPAMTLLAPGDAVIADVRGQIRMVGVVAIDTGDDGAPIYRVGGFRDGKTNAIKPTDVVGLPGRKLPLVGWPLLAARHPAGQLALAGVAVLFLAVLLFSRAGHGSSDPGAPAHRGVDAPERLALPAGPPVIPVPEPAVPPEGAVFVAADDGTIDEVDPPAPTAVAMGNIPGALPLPYVGGLMSISPEDLRQVRFAQSRKGYDTDAVDRALEAVADALESLMQERIELIEQIKRLEREAERLRGSELGLTQALNAAKAETEAVKAEATRIVSAAQSTAATGVANAAATGGAGETAMVQLLGETRAMRSLLQSFLTQVHQPQADPDGRPGGS